MVGTLYCNHETENEVYGSDPVPCPFCGFGHGPEASDNEPDALGFEDSNDALRNALFDTPTEDSSDGVLHTYW